MEIRGERECRDCGTRWSYFETGEVTCPSCGSIRSVGTGDRQRHTDAHVDLDLTDVIARVDDEPLADLADDVVETCRPYVARRGFVRGGELKPLDEAYLVAAELRQAADVFGRIRDPTDGERLYFVQLLRAADTGERPGAQDVPERLYEARGLAAADAALEYRSEVTAFLDDPREEVSEALASLRDRAKRVRALQGDVPPAEADALVSAARNVGRYLIADDLDALAEARDELAAL